ncbi:MAG: gamma-glutamyl-gamma-aminobutyrate hydrolase family protein [Bacteroidota bacterium]
MRLLLLLLLGSVTAWTSAQDTLLLFNPTAGNIATIQNLAEEKLLNLEGYHILGIYHAGEAYDYEETRASLLDNPDHRFSLRQVDGALDRKVLFGNNDCTVQFERLFMGSRGALFMGGPDIPPGVYNEPVHLLTNVTDPQRHFMETSFLFHLLGGSQDTLWRPFLERDPKYLVSGICLGMQTMNVATGGTLIQDIPTEVFGIWSAEEVLSMPPDQVHRNYANMISTGCEAPTSYHFHQINIVEGSFLQKELRTRDNPGPLVLSSHHQAVEEPGAGWVVAATSMDGRIIEAIEHDRYPNVMGVQFHPEKPGLSVVKDSGSYRFHKAYWRNLGTILQKR